MNAEIDEEELAGAMSASTAVVKSWGTLLAAAEEVMGPYKLDAGSGSGWIDGAEEPPKTKQKRNVYERPSYEESLFCKMLANEAALLDPATRETKQFCLRCRLPYRVFKGLMKCARKGKLFVEVRCDSPRGQDGRYLMCIRRR